MKNTAANMNDAIRNYWGIGIGMPVKTMETLCRRLARVHPGYRACYHPEWSEKGCQVVWIATPDGESSRYTFTTCKEFREWIDGVVLD